MKQIKLDYEAPAAETFVVRFEENILSGQNSANTGYEDNNLGDLDDEG